jgi:hypothetical protein
MKVPETIISGKKFDSTLVVNEEISGLNIDN